MCLIFVLFDEYKNFFATKISRITVYVHLCTYVLCVRGTHNALGPCTSVARCGNVGREIRAGKVINSAAVNLQTSAPSD